MDRLKVQRALTMLGKDKFTDEEKQVDELLSMAIALTPQHKRIALVDEMVEELVASLGVMMTMKYVNLVDIVKNATGLEREKVEETLGKQLAEVQEETIRMINEIRGDNCGER